MTKRYIAHITIEADTPLKVGSSQSDFMKDSPIQRDWNGLPMILGTSIAGVLRKDFDGTADEIFGKESGSKVIFSNALLLDEKQKVNERLLLNKSKFLELFDNLPIREHTAITDKGVTKEHSKFDEEVVYKGSRFKFSLEMLDDKEAFDKVLRLLQSSSFRLGGGSTKGFGKFKIVEIGIVTLETTQDLEAYASSLNSHLEDKIALEATASQTHTLYRLKIEPDDFFMFGSGFGEDDIKMIPVMEEVVIWKENRANFSSKQILIPASSIKGALSHRTAFYYNKAIGVTIESGEAKVGENNEAVNAIFGHKKEMAEDKKTELGQKGKVLISDCFKEDRNETKVFDHVAIDRFTGGAKDGALFQEKTTAQKDKWNIEILLEHGVAEPFVEAFEQSLDDICSGMLALGGATTKGHGVFAGTWSKS